MAMKQLIQLSRSSYNFRPPNRLERPISLTLSDELPLPQRLQSFRVSIDEELAANSSLFDPIDFDSWDRCVSYFLLCLDILEKHPNIMMRTMKKRIGCEAKEIVRGDLADMLLRISFEFYSNLKLLDVVSTEYEEWLQYEIVLFVVSQRTLDYLHHTRDFTGAAQVAHNMLYILHYNGANGYDELRNSVSTLWKVQVNDSSCYPSIRLMDSQPNFPADCRELMETLLKVINSYGDDEEKTLALLCNIYHLALLNRFRDSVECMVKFMEENDISGLEKVKEGKMSDHSKFMQITNQFYFNRAMAQIGLCAFRNGFLKEARIYLSRFSSTVQAKKLLRQDLSHLHFRDKNLKSLEKSGHIPYHMHIDLELLEQALRAEPPKVTSQIVDQNLSYCSYKCKDADGLLCHLMTVHGLDKVTAKSYINLHRV